VSHIKNTFGGEGLRRPVNSYSFKDRFIAGDSLQPSDRALKACG